MAENIYVNYLSVEGTPFINFTVVSRPAIVAPPVKDNMKSMYAILMQLSSKGIADAYFAHNTIFVKGNDYEAIKWLKESKVAFIGDERKTMRLKINKDLNIIRALFYRALLRYVEKKGFKLFESKRSKQKKLLPLGIDLEELIKQGLATSIGSDLVLYRGLYVMLEIFDNGEAILWVDVYSPIVKLSEQRPLSPKEVKSFSLMDTYTSFILTPIKRLELTNKLLGILCSDSKLNIAFADGYSVSFTCTFPIKGVRL